MAGFNPPLNIDDMLSKLTIAQKISLLTGYGLMQTAPVEEAGIPAMRMTNGPNSASGSTLPILPASCFPCATGLASSFDVQLVGEVGKTLGDECRAKLCHILLAPSVNAHRSPLGGRGFEYFSEDPHLSGTLATAYIKGVQSKGVAATIKHFVANDQEFERFSISCEVSERALREIYLKPFQIAIKDADPWALMASLSRVNGVHCSEDKWLIEEVLRKPEWGFKGMVMSDWLGTYSTVESTQAGTDLEMPGPSIKRGYAVGSALLSEKLFVKDIDARVRKVLGLLQHAYDSGIPFSGEEKPVSDTPEVRQLLRKAAAEAVVLLKNDKNLLPIQDGVRKIAVIGPNAKEAIIAGGGSASSGLIPTYTVSPLKAITSAAKEIKAEVKYALGVPLEDSLPSLDPYISIGRSRGALVEFWSDCPASDWLTPSPNLTKATPTATWSSRTGSVTCAIGGGDMKNGQSKDARWIRLSATFTPNEDGSWEIDISAPYRGTLFIDGKLVVEFAPEAVKGVSRSASRFQAAHARGIVHDLEAGSHYTLEVRLERAESEAGDATPVNVLTGLHIRGAVVREDDPEELIKEAVELAKSSDVVILVVGLNGVIESENYDRTTMVLPGLTDRLVAEVLAVNSKTVVVNQSGTPVEMPWIDQAHAVLQAFYGGNEVGNGMADVIFGKVNPSGKLPMTFPKRIEDTPSFTSFSDKAQVHGKVLYNEGIFVGYRSYEIKKLEPLFPFGHGLSFTTFKYSALEVSPISDKGTFSVSFTVENTGRILGREAAQVYIGDPEASLLRPVKELKAFAKVTLEPGQSEQITLHLDKYALSFYDERRGAWIAEAGKFDVLVAASSADVRLSQQVELGKSFHWTGL